MSDPVDAVRAAEAAERAHALDLLAAVEMLRGQIAPLEKGRKRAADELKGWLALNGGEISDPERGMRAYLRDSNGADVIDLLHAIDTVEGCEAIIEAAKSGMLRLDIVMLDRFRADAGALWADTLNRHRMPGGVKSTSLIIGEDDK